MSASPTPELASVDAAAAGSLEGEWIDERLTNEQRAAIEWTLAYGDPLPRPETPHEEASQAIGSASTELPPLTEPVQQASPATELTPGPIDPSRVAELGITASGLRRRRRGEQGAAYFTATVSEPKTTPRQRRPDEIKSSLESFRKGMESARGDGGRSTAAESTAPVKEGNPP